MSSGSPAALADLERALSGGRAQEVLEALTAAPLECLDADHAYLLAAAASQLARAELLDLALAQCLKQDPRHPGAHFQQAALALQAGQLADARNGFAQAAQNAPGWAHAHYNLGVVQAELGELAAAEASYRRALLNPPMLPQAANNLADLLARRGALDEAVALMHRALAAAPAFAIGWCTLGRSLLRQRQLDAAEEALRRAIALDPGGAAAWESLGDVHQLRGDVGAAAEAYSRALALNPEPPVLAFKLDSLRGAQPPRPPDRYVSELFDGMAAQFDHWLVDTLGYSLPQQLGRYLPDADGLDVLDLGCGTGLAAPALRPRARRLEGADLSAGMLEKAAARGLYDALHLQSLQQVLACSESEWDLLLATDVFIYVGALDELLPRAWHALKPRGRLLFSIEALDGEDAPAFLLQASGRYAHGSAALRRLADMHGFDLELDEPIDLRCELGTTVPGRVMRLRKRV